MKDSNDDGSSTTCGGSSSNPEWCNLENIPIDTQGLANIESFEDLEEESDNLDKDDDFPDGDKVPNSVIPDNQVPTMMPAIARTTTTIVTKEASPQGLVNPAANQRPIQPRKHQRRRLADSLSTTIMWQS